MNSTSISVVGYKDMKELGVVIIFVRYRALLIINRKPEVILILVDGHFGLVLPSYFGNNFSFSASLFRIEYK